MAGPSTDEETRLRRSSRASKPSTHFGDNLPSPRAATTTKKATAPQSSKHESIDDQDVGEDSSSKRELRDRGALKKPKHLEKAAPVPPKGILSKTTKAKAPKKSVVIAEEANEVFELVEVADELKRPDSWPLGMGWGKRPEGMSVQDYKRLVARECSTHRT